MDAENLRKEQKLKNRTSIVEPLLIHFAIKWFGENIFFSVKKSFYPLYFIKLIFLEEWRRMLYNPIRQSTIRR